MTLRIGMIGPGGMGRTHIDRIHSVIAGGRVVAVADLDHAHAERVAASIDAIAYEDTAELIAAVDAVMICSYGPAHAPDVIAAVEAGKPVLVEKPMATTAADCQRIMAAEQRVGRKLVTVGFMRRFDASYRQMKQIFDSGEIGEALMVHCAHRNPTVTESYTWDMAITDTAVHEIDTMRWLLAEEYVSARVDKPRKTTKRFPHLQDPLVLILTTTSGVRIDVEIFVNAQYGYDIQCELVAEKGVVRLGDQDQVVRGQGGRRFNHIVGDHNERFGQAFVTEMQEWIAAAARGEHSGSSAWDGYAAAVASDAGVKALTEDGEVAITLVDKPPLYA